LVSDIARVAAEFGDVDAQNDARICDRVEMSAVNRHYGATTARVHTALAPHNDDSRRNKTGPFLHSACYFCLFMAAILWNSTGFLRIIIVLVLVLVLALLGLLRDICW